MSRLKYHQLASPGLELIQAKGSIPLIILIAYEALTANLMWEPLKVIIRLKAGPKLLPEILIQFLAKLSHFERNYSDYLVKSTYDNKHRLQPEHGT